MISITRLNGQALTINALFIETIEDTPDTLITLTSGKRVMVLESVEEVTRRMIDYLQQIGLIRASVLSMESEESE